jgi:hypothetical protein
MSEDEISQNKLPDEGLGRRIKSESVASSAFLP